MPKDVFEFSCPCCGKRVEVDVRTGAARAVHFEESKKGKDLEGLIAEQSKESQRLGDVFQSAQDQQRRQKERLEDLLKGAKEEVKKEKDKPRKPANPFDLE